jgi:hypothetical protein
MVSLIVCWFFCARCKDSLLALISSFVWVWNLSQSRVAHCVIERLLCGRCISTVLTCSDMSAAFHGRKPWSSWFNWVIPINYLRWFRSKGGSCFDSCNPTEVSTKFEFVGKVVCRAIDSRCVEISYVWVRSDALEIALEFQIFHG